MADPIPTPEEYAEMVKDTFSNREEDTDLNSPEAQEQSFLKRVLGPELYSWMERGRKYAYGCDFDEDGEPVDQ